MNNLEKKLPNPYPTLKYETRFNLSRAINIAFGTFVFLATLLFLTQPTLAQYRYIGSILTVILMRMVFGSPFETQLTQESQDKLIRYLHEVDSPDDTPTDASTRN